MPDGNKSWDSVVEALRNFNSAIRRNYMLASEVLSIFGSVLNLRCCFEDFSSLRFYHAMIAGMAKEPNEFARGIRDSNHLPSTIQSR